MIPISFYDLLKELSDASVLAWLKEHSDVDCDEFGQTAISQAALEGRVPLVLSLIESKLSPLWHYGASAVGSAFDCRSQEAGLKIIKLCLENKYPSEAESPSVAKYAPELNEPMVHAAIRRARFDILEYLLSIGASLDMYDDRGVKGRDLLADLNDVRVKILLDKYPKPTHNDG